MLSVTRLSKDRVARMQALCMSAAVAKRKALGLHGCAHHAFTPQNALGHSLRHTVENHAINHQQCLETLKDLFGRQSRR
jgi:hypothetical protein